MSESKRPILNEDLYRELERAERKLAESKLDARFGIDPLFTEQAKSLQNFVENLRNELRDTADEILIANNRELKKFLVKLGIHVDFMEELREDGQVAGSVGSAIESVVKLACPLL